MKDMKDGVIAGAGGLVVSFMACSIFALAHMGDIKVEVVNTPQTDQEIEDKNKLSKKWYVYCKVKDTNTENVFYNDRGLGGADRNGIVSHTYTPEETRLGLGSGKIYNDVRNCVAYKKPIIKK